MNACLPWFDADVSGAVVRLRRQARVACVCLFAVATIALPAGPASAQHASAPSAKPPVCVDVEVDGEHTLSYDCLSRQLSPTASPDSTVPGGTSVDKKSAAEALATQPSNRVGTFNLSTERNRFGSNWGKSVQPQRPAPPVPVPPGH
ncbi:hypothetical protein [Paraburkholderia sp.]|uniref:hypothetical protein n=1 Tax=Paraburkholderia sp. TaxID=1926495 RepID=UPI003D6EA7A2